MREEKKQELIETKPILINLLVCNALHDMMLSISDRITQIIDGKNEGFDREWMDFIEM